MCGCKSKIGRMKTPKLGGYGMTAVQMSAGYLGAQYLTNMVSDRVATVASNPLVQAGIKLVAGAVTIGLAKKSKAGKNVGVGMMASGVVTGVRSFLPQSINDGTTEARLGAISMLDIANRRRAARTNTYSSELVAA